MKLKIFLICSTVIGLLFGTANLIARELPSYYPDSFQHKGVVGRLDTNNRIIVVNDGMYALATTVKVHTPLTEFSTLSSVKPGKMIGIGFTEFSGTKPLLLTSGGKTGSPPTKAPMQRRPNLQRKVSEIWVLPNNYKPFPRNKK